DELSDCHDSDDDWYNDEFENLKQISQTVFNVIIKNAKLPISFTNKRLLVYIRNSERTQRRKKLAAKTATAEQEGFKLALEDLKKLIANKSLILQVKTQLQLIMQYINLRLSGLKRMNASKTLAISIKKGDNQA
ncbi:16277_t:CDS:2, partial [Funneliformis caledonium]